MARSAVSSVMVLSFLVVAAFCVAQASAAPGGSKVGLVDVNVFLNNKCSSPVTLQIGAGKVLCPIGQQAVLKVKVVLGGLALVDVYLLDKNGKLVKLEVKVNLAKLVKLVSGVLQVVFDLVEEVAADGTKTLKLFCGKTLLQVIVKVNL